MFGATLDLHDFRIRSPHYYDIDIRGIPFQAFKPTILDFSFSVVHRVHSATRTVLAGSPTLDVRIFQDAIKGEDEHHVNVVRAIASLGTVDQSLLVRFGAHTSSICPFCHAATSSISHLLWFCQHPKLVEARCNFSHEDQRLVLDNVGLLPANLLYGIPDKMTLMPCTPWWTDHFTPPQAVLPMSFAVKQLVGIDDSYASDSDFCNWLRPYSKFDASLAFLVINGIGNDVCTPDMPPSVQGTPGETPDVFSDGSLSNAARPCYGLASAGVWCPDRTSPPCDLEMTYAVSAAREKGVGLYAKIDGYIASSARSELLGLIVA
eukprot:996976-Karenia_brevis.AAC.1